MISVPQAEQIIQSCKKNYGATAVPLLASIGRVLAEDIIADRDLPPYQPRVDGWHCDSICRLRKRQSGISRSLG